MNLYDILKDPVRQGIQGVVAVVMLLLYLWEKRDQFSSPAKFIGRTVFLLATGWLALSLLFAPIAVLIWFTEGQPFSSSVAEIVFGIVELCLLVGTAPSLAAMTSQDKKPALKRALTVGALNYVVLPVYWYIQGSSWPGFRVVASVPPVVKIVLEILVSGVVYAVTGMVIGLVAWAGVVRGRAAMPSRVRA